MKYFPFFFCFLKQALGQSTFFDQGLTQNCPWNLQDVICIPYADENCANVKQLQEGSETLKDVFMYKYVKIFMNYAN